MNSYLFPLGCMNIIRLLRMNTNIVSQRNTMNTGNQKYYDFVEKMETGYNLINLKKLSRLIKMLSLNPKQAPLYNQSTTFMNSSLSR